MAETIPLTVDLHAGVKVPEHPFASTASPTTHWTDIMANLKSIRERLLLAAIGNALKAGEKLTDDERLRLRPALEPLLVAFHEATGVAWDKVQWDQ